VSLDRRSVGARPWERDNRAVPGRRLSALDASFLQLETPTAHMHVAWKGVFAPPTGDRPVTLAGVRALIESRLALAPRFRERLAFPPGGMSPPVWVDDEDFELANHVTPLSDESPLHRARFDELCDLVLSEPLDRSRPLWRAYLVPRLGDGSVGLLMKMHHAMVDGMSAVALGLLLLDADRDAAVPAIDDRWVPRTTPAPARLALDQVLTTGQESLRAAGRAVRMAGDPRNTTRIAATLRRAAMSTREDLLRPAPTSWVNAEIGPRRTLAGCTADLDAIRSIKRDYGGTFNDVVLAIVAGAMRQLALERRTTPSDLRVMVPVSRRGDSEAGSLGNRISFVFIDLPVRTSRPRDRLRRVRSQTQVFKHQQRAAGAETLLEALSLMPVPIQRQAARAVASPRVYNLTVSNIPGPREPVYLLGARLLDAYPVVPLSEGHALSIGAFTVGDRVCFGCYADPRVLPEARSLPQALSAATLELQGIASARPRERSAA
jgi:WS/DGAT/MGAT family acyltransferase